MKLLLIMPNFFDYPEVIIKEIESMGYKVDYFDDRPSTSTFVKAILRVNPKLLRLYVRKYFNKIMRTITAEKYDKVFLISGQSLSFSEKMMEEIKYSQPSAEFILYQWDSIRNFPYIGKVQRFFDKCYSFDKKDCEINEKLKFLPLFYSEKYEKMGRNKLNFKEYTYDLCFVGTAHPRKYQFVKKIKVQLEKAYSKQFIYLYFQSRLVYFYRKIKNKELRNSNITEFHYKPINGKQLEEVYENSFCILDSPQDGQFGLTIRTIEALGAKKKIITTNSDIVNYDFYHPENIYVYDGSVDLSNIFFKSEYIDIPNDIYNKYSLKSWLNVILS